MASTTRSSSSTPSSSLPAKFYDVYLSFRGGDTRKNFADPLFAALVRSRVTTFTAQDNLDIGEEIACELLKLIEGSRISIVIFSRNYAGSRWCLDELVKIMECKTTFQQIVLPVFYDVDPSDVRRQRGSFAEAFAKHEARYKASVMEGKVERWRAALTEAANLSGFELQNMADGWSESTAIERIVQEILVKINVECLLVAKYPVGIESRVQRAIELLGLRSSVDVRMVGIWGIGGIGKTTIARAIYNQIHLQFEGRTFLANVREISNQPNGLVRLQEQFLSDILLNDKQKIRNVHQGVVVIKQKLHHKRVLVVLDDVDDLRQLDALAIGRDWFHPGSRIIITTRDESLLNLLEVDGMYMPELLSPYESLQLFSCHAFIEDHPMEGYVGLSWEVVGYAKGLPLAVEVLGSFLFGRTMHEWQSALENLKLIPHEEIQSKLKISFDSLSEEQKDLFLDIACFFVGMDQNYTIKILDRDDFFPETELEVLSRRCLVRIDRDRLTMHDLLRDMGIEIARSEHPVEPGRCRRLSFHHDVLDVLRNYEGTKAVEGLVLNLPRSNDVQVDSLAFAKMNRLRLLKLNYVHLSGSYEYLSKRLRWLYWFGFPLKSIPSNLFMENVVVIDMRCSSLEHVWKGRKELSAVGGFSILFPGGEFPDYSQYESVGSVLSFVVPLLPNQKILGWTLCIVIAGCIDKSIVETDVDIAYPLLYEVKNKTKGLKRYYGPTFHDRPLYAQDHTWLHYAPKHFLELQVEAGDEIEYSVSFTADTQILVKKCGVNMIYEDDEKQDQAMIQYA